MGTVVKYSTQISSKSATSARFRVDDFSPSVYKPYTISGQILFSIKDA